MQPCGLRDLAHPWVRRSFGPKTGQVADCIRGTLGPKGAKKHSCNPAGCGIWRALGGNFRLASRPGGLRTAPAAPWPKGVQKTFMQPCGLRDLARPRRRQSFGLKAGRVAECIRRTLAEKALKKHSCNPADCGIWHVLGGYGRLASRSDKLRNVSAEP